LTQKWDINKLVLIHILNLFTINKKIGSIEPHSAPNTWEVRINGVKNCKFLFPYFDKYSLHSKKKLSYFKWKALLLRLENGEHLDENKRLILKEFSKKINK
jgi:hypothetical protein